MIDFSVKFTSEFNLRENKQNKQIMDEQINIALHRTKSLNSKKKKTHQNHELLMRKLDGNH